MPLLRRACLVTLMASGVGCNGMTLEPSGSTDQDASAPQEPAESEPSAPTSPIECTGDDWDDDGDPLTPCVPHLTCPAGTVQERPADETSDPTCTACPRGTYCAGGDAPRVACGNGTFDRDSSAKTPCVAWTTCSPGTYAIVAGSATDDVLCYSCPPGTFSDVAMASACVLYTGTCEPGTYAVENGAADRSCLACPSGTNSTTPNSTRCFQRAQAVVAPRYKFYAITSDGRVQS